MTPRPGPDRLPEHVYVVDDDAVLLAFLEATLARSGHVVQAFADAETAWAQAQLQPPALWLIDVRMPGLDGVALLKRLRASPAHGATPVIMLTGSGRIDRVVEAMAAGANDYMAKPFSPQDLAEKAHAWLDRSAAP